MKNQEEVLLFTVTQDKPNRGQFCYSEYRFYLDTKTGIPNWEIWSFTDMTMRPGVVSPGSKTNLSYEEMLKWAKFNSEEMYNKYNGINEDNWIDYVIDLI